MKRHITTALILTAALTAFAADPNVRIDLDIQTPNQGFSIPSFVGDATLVRAYLWQRGQAWNPYGNYGARFGFGTNGVWSDSLVIVAGTPGTNYVDFALTSAETADIGEFFAQVQVTNSSSRWIFGNGTILVDESPFGTDPGNLNLIDLPQGTATGQLAVYDGTNWVALSTSSTSGQVLTAQGAGAVPAYAAVAGGDITGVTAGSYLSGGGASGDVTLNVTGLMDTATASATYLTQASAGTTYQPTGTYVTVESDPSWVAASSSVLYAESDPVWVAASGSVEYASHAGVTYQPTGSYATVTALGVVSAELAIASADVAVLQGQTSGWLTVESDDLATVLGRSNDAEGEGITNVNQVIANGFVGPLMAANGSDTILDGTGLRYADPLAAQYLIDLTAGGERILDASNVEFIGLAPGINNGITHSAGAPTYFYDRDNQQMHWIDGTVFVDYSINTIYLRSGDLDLGGGSILNMGENSLKFAINQGVTSNLVALSTDANTNLMWAGATVYTISNSTSLWSVDNDGTGSGLDADLLDGQHGSYYRDAGNLNAGTVPNARLDADLQQLAINVLSGTWSNSSGEVVIDATGSDAGVYSIDAGNPILLRTSSTEDELGLVYDNGTHAFGLSALDSAGMLNTNGQLIVNAKDGSITNTPRITFLDGTAMTTAPTAGGDITAVTAGAWLSGGGASGDVTLNVTGLLDVATANASYQGYSVNLDEWTTISKNDTLDKSNFGSSIDASLDLADSAMQPGDNATELDGTANRAIYVDTNGDVVEQAFGTSGQVWTSGGTNAAPTWETPSAGGGGFDSNTLAVARIITTQTVTAGSTDTIAYKAVVTDTGGNFNTNTATYTAPSDGFYYAAAHTRDNSARTVDRIVMILVFNGASSAMFDSNIQNAGQYFSPHVTYVGWLAAGQTIYATYNPTTVNSSLAASSRSNLIIYKL